MNGKHRCLDPSHPTLLSPLLLILSAIYLSHEAAGQEVGTAVRTALRAHTRVHIKTVLERYAWPALGRLGIQLEGKLSKEMNHHQRKKGAEQELEPKCLSKLGHSWSNLGEGLVEGWGSSTVNVGN
jgi:hypothetical protein